jgi:hypothetical protein
VMSWMPSFNLVCQTCHVGWGALTILATALFMDPWLGIMILGIWILVKDFWFDLVVEKDTIGWPGSTEDGFFYLVGAALGLGLWFLSRSL